MNQGTWFEQLCCFAEDEITAKMKYRDNFVSRTHRLHGQLHMDNGKPAIITTENGTTTSEWYKHGVRARDGDLPAIIVSGSDGTVETYYLEGIIGRAGNEPAVVIVTTTQIICRWYELGVIVRETTEEAFEDTRTRILIQAATDTEPAVYTYM